MIMTTWARGQTRKPVHSPVMAAKSMAALDKKNICQETNLLSEHLAEPPALLAVPGGEHQHRGDEAQAVRLTERSPVSLRNLAL